MKIAWLSHTGDLGGGAERCYWEGIKGIVSRGHEVHAILPWRGDLTDKLIDIDVPVSIIPLTWWVSTDLSSHIRARRLFYNMRLAWNAVSNLLKQTRPDVVVTNTLTIPHGALAARRNNIPHVWHIHEFGREDHNLVFDLGDRLSLFLIDKFSKRIIINSLAVQDKFRKVVPPDKLSLIYYAVDVPAHVEGAKKQNNGWLDLILVGHLAPGKRQEDAIKSVSILFNKQLNVRLTLIGNEGQEYGTYLRKLAVELGVKDRIDFVGFTQNPFAYVAVSDVALMCSQSEAFGRVTVEAMKLGKPVVGARSGATPELIRDGVNGFLYQVGDPEDLANKIAILYNDRPLLSEMGQNAREWSNRTFSMENYTTGLLTVFEDICALNDGEQRPLRHSAIRKCLG